MIHGVISNDQIRYSFNSCLRLIGGGFSQFRPYFFPVIRAQVFAGDGAMSSEFNT